MKKHTIIIACLLILNGLAYSQPVKPIDLNELDSSIKPGDNFFDYVNGKWMARTPIPPSKIFWGSFATLNEKVSQDIKKLLESASKNPGKGRLDQLTGDFFASGMDSAMIEKLSYSPINKYLNDVDAAANLEDIKQTMLELRMNGIASPVWDFSVEVDAKKTTQYIPYFRQGGLGLPDRDYYFRTDSRTTKIKDEYRSYITDMFKMIGVDSVTASQNASIIIDLETKIAANHLSKVEQRDPERIYNKESLASFSNLTPNIGWEKIFNTMKIKRSDFIVNNPAFFHFVDSLLPATPLSTWKIYIKWNILNNAAPYLSTDFVNRRFVFRKVLYGQKELSPRWQRMSYVIDNNMGDALGKLYVDAYFKPEAKQRMLILVKNIQEAFAERIKKLDWMSDSTKKKALIKLEAISKKIAYPEKWKDYNGLVISNNNFFQNIINCSAWNFSYNIKKLQRPVDKNEWRTTPQTVNAYYSPSYNDISFPAAILQAPFFYFTADDAINYGAIGSVIGHEITHGFDDEGRKFDADGNIVDWWTSDDSSKFETQAKKLVNEFNDFTVLDTVHVNGKLTLGENIADLGGLQIAYDAFKKTAQGKSNVKVDGFTPDQRFFIAYAEYRRMKVLPEMTAQLIIIDPHAPEMYRVNGILYNLDVFYKAFNIKPGDKLYKPESERIKIW